MIENWLLALLIHCLTQTSIHLIPFIFSYYLLQEKRRLLFIGFFHRVTTRGLLIYCLIQVCGSAGNQPEPFGDLWTGSLTTFTQNPSFIAKKEVMKFVIIPGVPSSSYSVLIVLQVVARRLFHGWIYININLKKPSFCAYSLNKLKSVFFILFIDKHILVREIHSLVLNCRHGHQRLFL